MLDDLLTEDRARTFDLADAPLTRMALIRCTTETWEWVWTTHHLIADGWSLRIMLEELFADYRGELRSNAAETFRYRDFVALANRSSAGEDEAFWRSTLAGFEQPHRLEVPGLPPVGVGHHAQVVTLGRDTSEALARFARSERVTLNTAVMGAWCIVLSRWMRTRDIVFGVTSSGRDPMLPGVEHGVGLFINTLPMRIDVTAETTLGSWLRDLQNRQGALRAHELDSLASVQRWSDVEAGVPLFESIFVFESIPGVDPEQGNEDPRIIGSQFSEHSNYPLAILVHPGEEIAIRFIHDRSRLSDDAVHSLQPERSSTPAGSSLQLRTDVPVNEDCRWPERRSDSPSRWKARASNVFDLLDAPVLGHLPRIPDYSKRHWKIHSPHCTGDPDY
jgi:hypothetical protein